MALEQMMRPEEQPQAPGALSQSRPPVQQQDYAQQMMSTMLNRVNPTAYTGLMDRRRSLDKVSWMQWLNLLAVKARRSLTI